MARKQSPQMRVSDRENTRLHARLARSKAEEIAERQAKSVNWLDQLDSEVLKHRIVIQAMARLLVEGVPLRRRVREYLVRLWKEWRIRPLSRIERFEALKDEEFQRFKEGRACEALAAALLPLGHTLRCADAGGAAEADPPAAEADAS